MNENMDTMTVLEEVPQTNVGDATRLPIGAKIALGVTVLGGAGYLIYKGIKKAAGAIKAKVAKKRECVECEDYTDVAEECVEDAQ